MPVNVFHISQKVKCCFLSQSWVATQSFRHLDRAPVISIELSENCVCPCCSSPRLFWRPHLWLGALHQRHKCPVAAISEWKIWSNYLKRKASWLLKTLRRRKLQNQIMLWYCSTAPSPQQPWKTFFWDSKLVACMHQCSDNCVIWTWNLCSLSGIAPSCGGYM